MDLDRLDKLLFGEGNTSGSPSSFGNAPDSNLGGSSYLTEDEVDSLADEASKTFGVPKHLIRGIIEVENPKYDPKAKNPASSAKGLMQTIDSTSKALGINDPTNPRESVFGGTKLIKQLLDKYGDEETATAAYFQGESKVDSYLKSGKTVKDMVDRDATGTDTQSYLSKVAKNKQKFMGGAQESPTTANFTGGGDDRLDELLFGKPESAQIPLKQNHQVGPYATGEAYSNMQPIAQPVMQPITGMQQPTELQSLQEKSTEKKQLPFVGNFVEMLKTMARTPISMLRGIGEGAMSATNKIATGQIDNAIKSLNDNKDKYVSGIPENDPIIKKMLSGLPFITYDKLQEIKNEKGVYDTQSLYSMLEDAKNKRTEFNPKGVTEPIRSIENLLKEKDVERLGGVGGVLQDLTSGVTQVAAQLGLNAINPSLAATSMISLIGGSSIEELEKKGVDPMDGAALSLANAALQYPLEKLGLEKIANNVAVKNATGKVLKRVVSSFLGEGVTEGIQEIPDYILTDWFVKTKGMNLKEKIDTLVKDLPELGKRAGYSVFIGGLTGSAVTGAGIAVDQTLNGKERAEKKSIEDAWNQEMADTQQKVESDQNLQRAMNTPDLTGTMQPIVDMQGYRDRMQAEQLQGDESIAGKIASEQQQPEVETPEGLKPEPAMKPIAQQPEEDTGPQEITATEDQLNIGKELVKDREDVVFQGSNPGYRMLNQNTGKETVIQPTYEFKDKVTGGNIPLSENELTQEILQTKIEERRKAFEEGEKFRRENGLTPTSELDAEDKASKQKKNKKEIKRKLSEAFLETDDHNEAFKKAGYRNIEGFWVHPDVADDYINKISPEVKGKLKEEGFVYFDSIDEKGKAGHAGGIAVGDKTVKGISVNSNLGENWAGHDKVTLHELGHEVWESLPERQKEEFMKRELTTQYAKYVKDGKVDALDAHQEEFSELYAENKGDVSKIFKVDVPSTQPVTEKQEESTVSPADNEVEFKSRKAIWEQTRKEIEEERDRRVRWYKGEKKNVAYGTKWADKAEKGKLSKGAEEEKRYYDKILNESHKERIIEALAEGKKVPDEVLKDYPDLKLRQEESTVSPDKTEEVSTTLYDNMLKFREKAAKDRGVAVTDAEKTELMESSKRQAKTIIDAVDNKDIGELEARLTVLDNKGSRRGFEIVTGLTLPKTAKGTRDVIRKFVGEEAYDTFQKDFEENRVKKEEERKQKEYTDAQNKELDAKIRIDGTPSTYRQLIDSKIESGWKVTSKKVGIRTVYRITDGSSSYDLPTKKIGEYANIKYDEKIERDIPDYPRMTQEEENQLFGKKQSPSPEIKAVERPEEQKAEIEAINTNPTEPQKEAGNYRKAHIKRDGMDISIENAAGLERSGKDKSGKEWKIQMNHDYGYIRGTKGADAYRGRATDQLDVFINPGSEEGGDVFVVNQKDPATGKFDEAKVMMGFTNKIEAAKAYNSNYKKGWKGLKSIIRIPMSSFKRWAYSDLTKVELKSEYIPFLESLPDRRSFDPDSPSDLAKINSASQKNNNNTEQNGTTEKIVKDDEILFDVSGKGNFAKGKVMDETEYTYTIKTTSGDVIFKTKDLVKPDPDFKRPVEEVDRKNADTDVKLPGYEDKNFVARKREGFWWLYDKDSNEMVYGGDEFPFPSKESLIESAKENYKPVKKQTGTTKAELESTNNIEGEVIKNGKGDTKTTGEKTETVLNEKVETPSSDQYFYKDGSAVRYTGKTKTTASGKTIYEGEYIEGDKKGKKILTYKAPEVNTSMKGEDITKPSPKSEVGVPANADKGEYADNAPVEKDQTKTKAFKEWFGDWENDPENASKVVDESGKPIVVYHGTDTEFDSFDESNMGRYTQAKSAKKGFFFTNNIKNAEVYAGITKEDLYKKPGLYKKYDDMYKAAEEKVLKLVDSKSSTILGKNRDVERYISNINYEEESLKKEFGDATNFDVDSIDDIVFTPKTKEEETALKIATEKGIVEKAKKIINKRDEFYNLYDEMEYAVGILSSGDLKAQREGGFVNGQPFDRFSIDTSKLKPNVKKVYLDLKNPYVHYQKTIVNRDETFSDIIDEAKKNGNDGVIIKGTRDPLTGDVYIAFNPNQIKSATENKDVKKEAPSTSQGDDTASEKPKEPAGFKLLKVTNLADAGTYADIGESVIPGTKPATKKQEKEVVKDNEDVSRSMQMPEIVEMVKAINGGKVPRIKERIGRDPALNGIFKTGSQEIHLKADLFKDPIVAAKVLAHEIGHLSDYLPDKTMSRGNILGRIATLKRYTSILLNGKPQKKQIMDELKALSMKWKPFNPAANKKYTAYRNSSKELYADAFSVLINNPGMLEKEAPKFYDAFTQFLGRKPDLEKIYTEIQTRLFDPNAVGKHRLEGLYSMVDQTDNLRQEARDRAKKERLSVGDFIYKYLIDRDYALLKLIGKGKKGSENTAAKAQKAKDEIEQTKYLATRVQNFVEDIADNVLKPLSDNGLTHSDLGVYMFLNRASTERATIANPRGFGEVESISTMEELEKQLGKEKFEKLQGIDKAYRELRKSIILEAEKAGLYTPDLVKTMKERVDSYAKYSVASYMEEKFGGEASSKVFHQIGTLADIANPFVETVLQDMSVIRSSKINTMKSTVLDFLSEMGESTEADMVFSQDINGRIAKSPKDPNKKLVHRMKDGKMESFYISKEIADSFDRNPVESSAVAEIISNITNPVKQILVAKNPVWMARNVLRDFQATVKNNPEVKLRDIPKLAKYYSQAYTEVIGVVFKGNRSTDLREMRENFMLNPDRIYSGKDVYYDNEIERIATEWQVDPRQAERYDSVKGRINQAWDVLNKMGRVSELGGKLAGFKYLKNETDLSTDEIGHRIRTRIGTPDARRQGAAHQITNSVWMFSNISKEGTRSMIESFNEDKGAYIWKSLMLNVIPKLVLYGGATALAATGNDWLKKLLDKIPEYDKQSYSIIPIGVNDAGKAVYLRLPQDYDGQNWGAIAWALANGRVLGDNGAIERSSQFIPYTSSSLNPYIKVGANLFTYYVRGQNPIDDYRGRDIIPPKAFAAGGLEASKYMAENAWGQLGGSVIYDPNDFSDRKDDIIEKILKYPGLNVLGSFLRYSDRGETEKYYQEKNSEIKEKEKLSLRAEGMISKKIKNSRSIPTTDDIFESYRELRSEGVIPEDKTYPEFRNQFFRVAAKTVKDNDIKFLLKLSKKERREALPELQNKLSPQDYSNLVDDLYGMGALQ